MENRNFINFDCFENESEGMSLGSDCLDTIREYFDEYQTEKRVFEEMAWVY